MNHQVFMNQLYVGERVRIKVGALRDKYGTIESVEGDEDRYYGVRVDGDDGRPVGYSRYELEEVV